MSQQLDVLGHFDTQEASNAIQHAGIRYPANVAFEWFEKHACLGGKSWVTDTGMLDSIACFLSCPKHPWLLSRSMRVTSTRLMKLWI
jgi:hypothetical protein